jgi:hypothetical protein
LGFPSLADPFRMPLLWQRKAHASTSVEVFACVIPMAFAAPAPPRSYPPPTLTRVPDDLIDLPEALRAYRRAYDQAHAAVTAYIDSIDVPGQPRADWTAGQHAELARLRDVREAARKALWARPEHAAGRANGDWKRWRKLPE